MNKLNQSINSLEEQAATIAASLDQLRSAEGRNIQQAITNLRELMDLGLYGVDKAGRILDEISGRVCRLLADKNHAGRHEAFRESNQLMN